MPLDSIVELLSLLFDCYCHFITSIPSICCLVHHWSSNIPTLPSPPEPPLALTKLCELSLPPVILPALFDMSPTIVIPRTRSHIQHYLTGFIIYYHLLESPFLIPIPSFLCVENSNQPKLGGFGADLQYLSLWTLMPRPLILCHYCAGITVTWATLLCCLDQCPPTFASSTFNLLLWTKADLNEPKINTAWFRTNLVHLLIGLGSLNHTLLSSTLTRTRFDLHLGQHLASRIRLVSIAYKSIKVIWRIGASFKLNSG